MCGKEWSTSMPSPGAPFSPHLHVFTNLEALQTSSFWVFMEASFYRHGHLNHWPLVVDSTSSPFPGEGLKFHPSNHLVGSLRNQCPRHSGIQKPPSPKSSVTEQKTKYPTTKEIPRFLEAVSQKLWTKIEYVFLIYICISE